MLKRAMLWCAAVMAFALLAAVPMKAQMGAIEGDAKDENGKGLVGAQVVIERTDIKGTYKVKTDKKGHYYHGGLPLGRYTVTLMSSDKPDAQKMDAVNGVRVGLGDPTPINFDLKQVKERQMAAQAGIQLKGGGGGDAPQLTKEQKAQIEAQLKQREQQKQKMEKLQTSFNAGMEALKAKNFEEATTQLAAAAETDPTQYVVFANLAEAYTGLAKAKRGDEATAAWSKAIETYQKAITMKPDDASIHNNYALALVSSGKQAEGMEELNKAATLDPANAAQYYYNLGAVLTNSGRGKEAAEAFKKATEVNPNYADAWYYLGVSMVSDAKTDAKGKVIPAPGTVEALQKYVELKPDGPNAEAAKAMIQTLSGSVTTEIKAQKRKK